MAVDIVPELLSKIQADFDKQFKGSEVVSKIYARIRDGTATHDDSYRFAKTIGDMLETSFKKYLSAESLPDEKMYYNIAQRILEPTLKVNYKLANDVAVEVQELKNVAAGFNIKGRSVEFNESRLKGLVDRLSTENFSDVEWLVQSPITNFTESAVDDVIRASVEMLEESGITTYVVRTAAGGCCSWCNKLAGVYPYDDVKAQGNDVWKRHENCHCTLDTKTDKQKSLIKMRATGRGFTIY